MRAPGVDRRHRESGDGYHQWLGVQLDGGRLDVPTGFAPCGGGFYEWPVQPGVLAPERRG